MPDFTGIQCGFFVNRLCSDRFRLRPRQAFEYSKGAPECLGRTISSRQEHLLGRLNQKHASGHHRCDPLAYAFASYEGISAPWIAGTYNESRAALRISGWSNPESVLFDQPVSSLVEWAQVAVDSDAFARNLAMMFFKVQMEIMF